MMDWSMSVMTSIFASIMAIMNLRAAIVIVTGLEGLAKTRLLTFRGMRKAMSAHFGIRHHPAWALENHDRYWCAQALWDDGANGT